MNVGKRAMMAMGFALAAAAQAGLVIPGADGSDGVLHVTTNTTISLGAAVTGKWDDNNAANAGQGVYDPEKWAVVFKYSSVTVDAGATLTFANHPANPPVVWLVSGNVTIKGTVDLSGQNGHLWKEARRYACPGPGGFPGGIGRSSGQQGSGGFGPGGASCATNSLHDSNYGWAGAGGSFGTQGTGNGSVSQSGPVYGTPELLPLVGGSGGAGSNFLNSNPNYQYWYFVGGGAGGGAICIASCGTISLVGAMEVCGGRGGFWSTYDDIYDGFSDWTYCGGGGSGGGVRLVCDVLSGTGMLNVDGGHEQAPDDIKDQKTGGLGRVRVEANTISFTLPSLVTLSTAAPSSPVKLWPDAAVKNISLGGVSVPSDPQSTGGMTALTPSMAFNAVGNRELLVETTNLATTATVRVRVAPTIGDGERFFDAVCISGDITRATWKATISLAKGTSVIQVLASDVTLNP